MSEIENNVFPKLRCDNIDEIVAQLSDEEKCSIYLLWLAGQYSGKTYAVERLGIPSIIMTDGPTGPRVSCATYAHPTPSLVAQSWDKEAAYAVGESMGKDFRNCGVDIALAPGVNIQKYILGGRNFEYFSEDPYVAGIMGTAVINGIQSCGTGTSLKHFVANSYERGRQGGSLLGERALREIYARAFKYATTGSDPMTIMTSYNMVNNVRTNSSSDLMNIFLRKECKYDGAILSDWGALGDRVEMANNGLSIFCDGQDNSPFVQKFTDALKDGTLKREALDESVKDILKLTVKTHTFKGTSNNSMQVDDLEGKRIKMRKIAAESMVLLKNSDGTLPLKGSKVALYGNGSMNTLVGAYGSSMVAPSRIVNIESGIKNSDILTLNDGFSEQYKNCKAAVYYVNGIAEDIEVDISEQDIKNAAKTSDVAIMTLSRGPAEGFDIPNMQGGYILSDTEERMIKKVSNAFHAHGKKFIVLLNLSNPIKITSWEKYADAILLIGYAGEEIGDATVDVLTGKVNPSGKLNCTWPVDIKDTPESEYPYGMTTFYYDDIYVGYRYYSTFGVNTSYPFGYGMSYTDFEYSDFEISSNKFADVITASVTVKNIGDVLGREVVQFYVSKPDVENEQPKYELCGFAKTRELAPGESETVTVKITKAELETYVEARAAYVIEKGPYTVCAASSVEDIKAEKEFTVENEILVLQTVNICKLNKEINLLTKKEGKISASGRENIALNKYAEADFCENDDFLAKYAVDGNPGSRWSAPGGGENGHYITVDLGKIYAIDLIKLAWESMTAGEFEIHLSNDAESWTKYTYEKDTVLIKLDGVEARYIKVFARNSGWLSIYELEVYEK